VKAVRNYGRYEEERSGLKGQLRLKGNNMTSNVKYQERILFQGSRQKSAEATLV